MAIDTQEINNLLSDPANVSLPIKIGAVVIVFSLALFIGYKLVIVDQLATLKTVQSQEQDKRKVYEKKQARANQLPAYKAQLEEMQISFGALKDQLPSDTEIPGLILDISEKGLSNGLEIELFKPEDEIHKEFFAEKPIKIEAKGTYAELAGFVSDLSALPRIVTINNIQLQQAEEKKEKDAAKKNKNKPTISRLSLKATIKTYRYLSEEEVEGTEG
ncbi:type 4a pilus biogenesis protein PilO [Cocleimonas flava]|uniref:Type IV pilus assembly protein PilO n=1 Tax=Cocleimonas flava TaxID=634765 RepID=A0A4R1ENR2_9GAMM|nr:MULTISPECIES: type 4a pilus biogenesis protein PilO [Cocleimonas]MEB8432463.1 type 4a pilus biogenesis protein PilO [Cocleimonas sp. KMM 6892]MEC4715322.1 type 4a pilus biogenesis protein PilO [Cocleimonas sp. KMM 6895]MEC4745059.1 type 4a pilus biogenesis protein PilO [Cocleimonas sp. KMM 6896]TCJ82896.1 type IV pilus assembly protein PilO [Cocleimonas flava]